MIVSKLLAKAIKLWLKSQVSAIQDLEIAILSENKQILQGNISQVLIKATHAVYQDLHLSRLEIDGTNIRFDLSKVIKQKSFRLQELIKVELEIYLSASDLQHSCNSKILSSALTEIWCHFLKQSRSQNFCLNENYQWKNLSILESGIVIQGYFKRQDHLDCLKLKTQVELGDPHTLLLTPKEIITSEDLPIITNETLTFDLGEDVKINFLEITEEQISLQGEITIYP